MAMGQERAVERCEEELGREACGETDAGELMGWLLISIELPCGV